MFSQAENALSNLPWSCVCCLLWCILFSSRVVLSVAHLHNLCVGQIVGVRHALTCILTLAFLAAVRCQPYETLELKPWGSHGSCFFAVIRALCWSTFCSDWQQGGPVAVGGGADLGPCATALRAGSPGRPLCPLSGTYRVATGTEVQSVWMIQTIERVGDISTNRKARNISFKKNRAGRRK